MPKVPTLDGQQVKQSAGPSIRLSDNAPSEAFGVGPSGIKLIDTANNLFQQAKNNADQVAVTEAERKLSELETQLMYSPEQGAMNTQGRNSFEAVGSTKTKFQAGFADIEKGLSNNQQKAAARKLYENRLADVDRQLNRHVSGEIKKYDLEQTDGLVKAEMNAAMENPFDTERVGLAVQRQQAALYAYGLRTGAPPEELKNLVEGAASKTQAGAIRSMLAKGDDMAAEKYFEGVKGQLVGSDLVEVQKDIEEGSLRGKSQRLSASMYRGDLGSALNAARKIEDPKLQDATVERVKALHSQQEMIKNDRIEKLHMGATDIIDKTGSIDQIPPDVWTKFSLSERSQLKTYAENRSKGIQPSTNWKDYYELKTMASSPELRDKFQQIDLYSGFRGRLADAEFKELTSMQNGLRKGDPKAKALADGIQSDQQIVTGALREMGVNMSPKAGKKDVERANLFRKAVDEQVAALAQHTGKRPTNAEIQMVVKKLGAEVVTNKRSFWWDEKKRLFELEGEAAVDVETDQIPETERSKIEQALKRRKLPVSEETIKDLYLRQINSGASRASK